MKLRNLVYLLVLATPCFSQTAIVIPLSPTDADRAKSLYQQRDEINQKIEKLNKEVVKKYLLFFKDDPEAGYSQYTDSLVVNGGWVSSINNGFLTYTEPAKSTEDHSLYYHKDFPNGKFIFSKDFEYIVPEPVPTYAPSATWGSSCPIMNTLTSTSH